MGQRRRNAKLGHRSPNSGGRSQSGLCGRAAGRRSPPAPLGVSDSRGGLRDRNWIRCGGRGPKADELQGRQFAKPSFANGGVQIRLGGALFFCSCQRRSQGGPKEEGVHKPLRLREAVDQLVKSRECAEARRNRSLRPSLPASLPYPGAKHTYNMCVHIHIYIYIYIYI